MTASYVSAGVCSCGTPLPVERAKRKGAAVTVCARCGLPVPLRLGR